MTAEPQRTHEKVWALLPARNEAENLRSLLPRVRVALNHESASETIVVDDHSTDVTAPTAASFRFQMPIRVLATNESRGMGAALRVGIEAVLRDAGPDDWLAILDADSTHAPEQLPKMLLLAREIHGVVIASRYARGAIVEAVPVYRRLASRIANFYVRRRLPIEGVRDATCGFRVYPVAAIRQAAADAGKMIPTQDGFEATVELLLRVARLGVPCQEIPVQLHFQNRTGRSKMRLWATAFSVRRLVASLRAV